MGTSINTGISSGRTYTPDDLKSLFNGLERRIYAMEHAPSAKAMAVDEPGVFSAVTRSPSPGVPGTTIVYIGDASNGPGPNAGTQFCFVVQRDDGSPALSTFSGVSSGQKIAVYDAKGATLLAEDIDGGQGMLADPQLPLPCVADGNVNLWPSTTSTSWTSLVSCNFQKQHPAVYGSAEMYLTSGTAQLRLYDVFNGVQVGPTFAATAGSFTTASIPNTALTSGPGINGWQGQALLQVQGKITTGSGTLYALANSLYGCGSN